MKGFLYKDLCVLGSAFKSYAALFGVFAVLTLLGIYDLSFMGVFVPVLLCMSTLSSVTLDESARWDRFAVATPKGRDRVVRDKYRLLLLSALLALVLELLLALLLALKGEGAVAENLIVLLLSTFGVLIASAVSLPLAFRFGYQKARIIVVGVSALAAGAIGSLSVIATLTFRGKDVAALLIGGAILTALALLGLPVSYHISRSIYRKKEF